MHQNNNTSLSLFLKDLNNIEPLLIEEEIELHNRIQQNDYQALNKLVTHNLRFVVSVVKKMPTAKHGRSDLEDLIAVGCESMMLAAKKWKPKPGIKFIGYAKSFIERSVIRYVENTENIIRLPVNIVEDIRKLKYKERVLLQQLGRVPTNTELCAVLGIEDTRLHQLRSYIMREPRSLDSMNNDRVKDEDES